MKRKTRAMAIVLAVIALAAGLGGLLSGHLPVLINNAKLKKAMRAVATQTVQLNEVVPFAWDSVYTFGPYQSKADMEALIGFKTAAIKENNISEGMVHLLFVYKNKAVASILGYDSDLGYRIDFSSKIAFDENARFSVTKTGAVVALSRTE